MHTSNSVWSRTALPESKFWMVFSWQSAASASSACVIFFSIIAVLISTIDPEGLISARMARNFAKVPLSLSVAETGRRRERRV